jgi:hypothetical protein
MSQPRYPNTRLALISEHESTRDPLQVTRQIEFAETTQSSACAIPPDALVNRENPG